MGSWCCGFFRPPIEAPRQVDAAPLSPDSELDACARARMRVDMEAERVASRRRRMAVLEWDTDDYDWWVDQQ